jgi:hypothetical protein
MMIMILMMMLLLMMIMMNICREVQITKLRVAQFLPAYVTICPLSRLKYYGCPNTLGYVTVKCDRTVIPFLISQLL